MMVLMLMTWYHARLMMMMSRWRWSIDLRTAGVCCFRSLCEGKRDEIEMEEGSDCRYLSCSI